MDDILKGVPAIIDKASRSTWGVTALSVLVLGSACYLLFGSAGEFMRLLVFAIIASAYLAFLWISGRL